MQQDKAGDNGGIAADASTRLRLQEHVLAGGQGGWLDEEAPDDQGDHARQHADAQQVAAQAVKITWQTFTQEDIAGQETLERIPQVYQQVIDETPGHKAMEQAGPEAQGKHRLQGDGFCQHAAEALLRNAPIDLALPAPDRANDAVGSPVSCVQRGQNGNDEEELFG